MSTTENTRRNLNGEQFRPMPAETKASTKTTNCSSTWPRSWPLSSLR